MKFRLRVKKKKKNYKFDDTDTYFNYDRYASPLKLSTELDLDIYLFK